MINNWYCNPRSIASFKNWAQEEKYYDSLSPYCEYYDRIYDGFFVWGNNTFFELASFSLQVFLAGFVVEIAVTLFQTRKLIDGELPHFLWIRFWIFIGVFIHVWAIGGFF